MSSVKSRFSITLCLGAVRTKDAQLLRVEERVENRPVVVNVGLSTLMVDDVVPRALPSRVATAVLEAIEESPPHTHSVHVLAGVPLCEPTAMGNAIVEHLLRAQHSSTRGRPGLRYDEALLFGQEQNNSSGKHSSSATTCETVRAADEWATVQQNTLPGVGRVSLVLLRYPGSRSAAVLLGPHVTTAGIAALAVAPRRAVYLCVDAATTARELVALVEETAALRERLCATLDTPAAHGHLLSSHQQHQMMLLAHHSPPASPGGAAAEDSVGGLLSALAHSDGELGSMRSTVERDFAASLAQVRAERAELAAERAAFRTELERERRRHGAPMSIMATPPRAQSSVPVTAAPGAASGAGVSGPVLTSHSVDTSGMREALREAQRARRFAEEKLRLLEFRSGLDNGPSVSRATSVALSASPSVARAAPAATATRPSDGEARALAQEFQRREHALQLQLRESAAELATAQAARREMENTLLLQSHTIAEAKRALAARGLSPSVGRSALETSVTHPLPPPPHAGTPPRRSGGMISPTRGPEGPLRNE